MIKTFLAAVCDDDTAVFDTVMETAKNAFAQNGAEAEIECFSSPAALSALSRISLTRTGLRLVSMDLTSSTEQF